MVVRCEKCEGKTCYVTETDSGNERLQGERGVTEVSLAALGNVIRTTCLLYGSQKPFVNFDHFGRSYEDPSVTKPY